MIVLFTFSGHTWTQVNVKILADYALPFAVIIMSFFGSYVFRGVKCKLQLHRMSISDLIHNLLFEIKTFCNLRAKTLMVIFWVIVSLAVNI